MSLQPDVQEVLKSILWTFDTHIAPNVHEPYAASLSLTVTNLLRHVASRIEHEGQALHDDNADLRELLREVELLANETPALGHVATDIGEVTNASYRGDDEWPSPRSLADEAAALRGALASAVDALIDLDTAMCSDEHYVRVRATIRAYLGRQLAREAAWNADAWSGPRR